MKKPPRPTVAELDAQVQALREAAARARVALLQRPLTGGWIPLDASPRERDAIDRARLAEWYVARLLAYVDLRDAGLPVEVALKQAMDAEKTRAATDAREQKAAEAIAMRQHAANAVLSVAVAALGKIPARYHKLLENLWPKGAAGPAPRKPQIFADLRKNFHAIALDDRTKDRVRSIVGARTAADALVTAGCRAALAAIVEEVFAA